MQAIPVMPMKPGNVIPAREAGFNSEPDGADTSFKQQLTDAGQNNDSSLPSADPSEQIADGLQTGTDMATQLACIFLPQPRGAFSKESGDENTRHIETEGNKLSDNPQPTPPLIILPVIMDKQPAMVMDKQPAVVMDKPPAVVMDKQYQTQFHIQPVPGRQDSSPPTLSHQTPELTGREGYNQKNINPSLVTLSPVRDTASNHIQAALPYISINNEAVPNNNSSNFQQQSGGEKRKTNTGTIFQQEQGNITKMSAQESPFILSMNRETVPGLTSTTPTGEQSSFLRLPSGTEVPHNWIVDQVINRFTMNRSLESGTVIMKMYPAELGELRMKITVDQETIRATIITHNPQVQEILDRYMSRLRDALEEQGLNLEHIEVSVNDDSGDDEQFFREQFNQHLNDKREENRLSSSLSLKDDQPEENINQSPENNRRLSVMI